MLFFHTGYEFSEMVNTFGYTKFISLNMKPIARRKFLKGTAMAGGALLLLPELKAGLWLNDQPSGNYFLKEFGIDENLCRKLLAKALSKGGDFADLYFEFTVSNYLGLEDGKVNQSYGDISLGVGIRTVIGDQIGYGFTQELTETSMLSAAATASTISDMSALQVTGAFNPVRTGNYYPVSSDFNGIPAKLKLPLLQQINQKCFDASAEIVKVNAGFSNAFKRVLIVTSDGIMAEISPFRIHIRLGGCRTKRQARAIVLEPRRPARFFFLR